ncbi:hypothetical protein P7K49_001657 [Saguinus oedipus]|uniref:Ribosome-recycling factor, mitochondrial n=1 Tax=Saguinus oedipus TaxID=9490 RepID=A0ABQ9WF42_SAGOE|nr:hypothetical protein P7K49_001657 [Saguinus oedipus]
MALGALGLKCFRVVHPAFCNYLAASIRPVSEVTLMTVHERQHGHRQYVGYPGVPVRHFATKKAKEKKYIKSNSKGKGQSQTRVNINTALVEDIINLEEVNEDMKSVIEALKDNFNKTLNIRTSPVLIPYWEPNRYRPAQVRHFCTPELDQEDSVWVNNFLNVAFLSGKCQNCLGELFADVMEKSLGYGSLDQIAVVTADGKLALNQISQISMKSPQLILVNMASFPEALRANLGNSLLITQLEDLIRQIAFQSQPLLLLNSKWHSQKKHLIGHWSIL